MSLQLSFNDFLALLPACVGPASSPAPEGDFSWPSHVPERWPDFIPPNLTELAPAPVGRPQVLILSAPGAVGKSTLAREISHARGGLLWDLSRYDQVGRGSLHHALGGPDHSQTLEALGRLRRAEVFVAIDALDEGQLKTRTGFAILLDDLASAATSAERVAFVLLGRTEVAEESWLKLNDLGVRTALYRIDFFDEGQRREYLDRRIGRDPDLAAYVNSHRAGFEQARDLIFRNLGEVIDPVGQGHAATEAAAFLGYAPVLEAIAVLLGKKPNFHELAQRLQEQGNQPGAAANSGQVRLLETVVDFILQREQQLKVLPPVMEALAGEIPDWGGWQEVYSSAEQSNRLLARVLEEKSWVPEVKIPPQIREQYEEKLAEFFDEHPFLKEAKSAANVVFRAYLYAKALVERHPLAEHVIEALSDRSPEVQRRHAVQSRLLADFYFYFRAEAKRPVPLAHVGLLYASLLTGETQARRLRLEVDAGDPEDNEPFEPSVEFEWIDPDADDSEKVSLGSDSAPLLVEGAGRLVFNGDLKDAFVQLRATVRLESDSAEFAIGPDVQIEAARLEIAGAEKLIVKGDSPRSGDASSDQVVVLVAREADVACVRKVTSYGSLSVDWPRCRAFPWTQYATEPSSDVQANPRLAQVYRRFRRIAMAFRSHKKGDLARFKPKIDHERMLQGPLGRALLEYLISRNLLYSRDKLYVWNRQDAPALVGVSWPELRRGFTPPKLVEFLRRFVETHQQLF